jgi:PIN like domain
LGAALREAGIAFVAHHERFAPAASDEEWLAGVAAQGWWVITRDQRIRYKINEQRAAIKARLHLFVFTQGGLSAAETALILVRAYPAMCRRAANQAPPAFWSLQRSGEVSALLIPLR